VGRPAEPGDSITVPVVIVATEEAIRVIPRSVAKVPMPWRPKFQTLVRVILPLSSPASLRIHPGVARARARLRHWMLTGVVNAAPTLPR